MSPFSRFSDLPTELRLKVWFYAVHSLPPRIIKLYPDWRLQEQNPPLPSIARVCREAREVAQRIYELSLGNGKRYKELQAILPALPPAAEDIYVNFEKDLIYLPCIRLPRPSLRFRATDDGKDLPWPVYNFPNVGILRAQRLATKIYFEGDAQWGNPVGATPTGPGLPGSAASVWERLSEFSDLKELYIINENFIQNEFTPYSATYAHQHVPMELPATAPPDYIDAQSRGVTDLGSLDGWQFVNAIYMEGLRMLWDTWRQGNEAGEPWPVTNWKIVAECDLPRLFEAIIAG